MLSMSISTAKKLFLNKKDKNICTAWVNFDGTTTPPTIRDSFNVSDVVADVIGVFYIYFEENMDNTNYTVSYTSNNQRASSSTYSGEHYPSNRTKSSIKINSTIGGNGAKQVDNSVQIFGGKN